MFRQTSPSSLTIFFTALLVASSFTHARAQSTEAAVANVNGTAITLAQIDALVSTEIYPLQQKLYAIRKSALDNLIVSTLLEREARKRGVSVEELRRQFTAGEVSVTGAEVEEMFLKNASYFAAMSPDEAKERLRLDLENKTRMKRYRQTLAELQRNASITITLAQPVNPLLEVAGSPWRGSANPVVTIVEFSDFECQYCRAMQPSLKQVVNSYGDSVRLIFKHLPLEGHANSLPAARASYCAGEQDKFWPFHDALFDREELSTGAINEIARKLSLNEADFQACTQSERSKSAVLKDFQLAQQFRIDGTPGFVINGQVHTGALSLAALKELIDRELNRVGKETAASAN